MNNVLTIAASDTSGGAGVQRDLKTFQDAGVWGISVVTGITAQSFDRVFYAGPLRKGRVEIQLKTVFENFHISAVKIGVVFNLKIMKMHYELPLFDHLYFPLPRTMFCK